MRRTNTPNMKPRKKISSTTGARTQIRIAQPIRTSVESSALRSVTSVWSLGSPKISARTSATTQKSA